MASVAVAKEGREAGGKASLLLGYCESIKEAPWKETMYTAVLPSVQESPGGAQSELQECQDHKELIMRHSRSHFLTHSARRRLLAVRLPTLEKPRSSRLRGPGVAAAVASCVSDRAPPFDLFRTQRLSIPKHRSSGALEMQMYPRPQPTRIWRLHLKLKSYQLLPPCSSHLRFFFPSWAIPRASATKKRVRVP